MTFYPKSRPRDDGRVVYSGYDHADTVADAVTAYRRTRTTKHFILTDTSPDLARLDCVVCGDRLDHHDPATPDGYRGNRVTYNRSRNALRPMHYSCSWGGLLTAIGTSRSLAEAAAKLDEIETVEAT